MGQGSTSAATAGVDPVPAPLAFHSVTVPPEWVDYNGHMSEWCYLLVMGDSADTFFRFVGIDEDYRAAGASLFTVETHIRNLLEVSLGERLRLELQLLGADDKRVHLIHRLLREDDAGDRAEVATGEQMLLHVDTHEGRVRPFPDELGRRIHRVAAVHAQLPVPDWAGNAIRRLAGPRTVGATAEGVSTWTSH